MLKYAGGAKGSKQRSKQKQGQRSNKTRQATLLKLEKGQSNHIRTFTGLQSHDYLHVADLDQLNKVPSQDLQTQLEKLQLLDKRYQELATYKPLEHIDLASPHPNKHKPAFLRLRKVVNSMLLSKRLTGEITFRLDKKQEDVLKGTDFLEAKRREVMAIRNDHWAFFPYELLFYCYYISILNDRTFK